MQTEREEKMAEVRAMRKQEREFNRKKEYARRCRIQVGSTPLHTLPSPSTRPLVVFT